MKKLVYRPYRWWSPAHNWVDWFLWLFLFNIGLFVLTMVGTVICVMLGYSQSLPLAQFFQSAVLFSGVSVALLTLVGFGIVNTPFGDIPCGSRCLVSSESLARIAEYAEKYSEVSRYLRDVHRHGCHITEYDRYAINRYVIYMENRIQNWEDKLKENETKQKAINEEMALFSKIWNAES
ncbi:hypothetical protein ACJU26_08720 [Acidithiobacillus sp. M4-SHS-6]|uniref:hypothetical protein n=1 Tax=Acidithiobacillus sp. M4-SHS-6 TaxID=3383024 RepID=UPI0039BE3688